MPFSATIPFQAVNVTVGPTLTLLATVPLAGLDGSTLSVQVRSAAGSAATVDFVVARKLHDAGDWLAYLGGSDFATATAKCAASTPGPHQLPAGGGSAWADVDCGAAVAVQLWAATAAGTASVTVLGSVKAR